MQENRFWCPVTPLLVTSIQHPSIVDLDLVFDEIQAHLNYWHNCSRNGPFQNPLYFYSYRRMTLLGIQLLMLVLTVCLLWSPAGFAEKTLYLHSREKLQLSHPYNLSGIPSIRGQLHSKLNVRSARSATAACGKFLIY